MRLNESGEKPELESSEVEGRNGLLKSRGRSLEVTGLGIIVSLMVAFWSLASDGTIRLSEYLIFLSFLLISASAMIWRICTLAPNNRKVAAARLQPGSYRVSFAQQRLHRKRPRP